MMFTSSIRKQGSKISYISKKSICNTFNSNVNSIESNHLNTSNSDNVIGNLNLPHINVQNYSTFNTLIIFQKETNADSIVNINDEIIYEKSIREQILSLIKIQQK